MTQFSPTRKLQTQSLAKSLMDRDEDLLQTKQIRDAAYKSGFAMAASIVKNYIKDARRFDTVELDKILKWADDARNWRKEESLKNVPELS